jgi:hypothetical protein
MLFKCRRYRIHLLRDIIGDPLYLPLHNCIYMIQHCLTIPQYKSNQSPDYLILLIKSPNIKPLLSVSNIRLVNYTLPSTSIPINLKPVLLTSVISNFTENGLSTFGVPCP